jgi:hypothetical protein
VRANRAFRLIVAREGLQPAFLADPQRLDRIEVVSVEDGEILLYWSLPAKEAAQLLRALRADLAGMDRDQFIRAWGDADAPTEA